MGLLISREASLGSRNCGVLFAIKNYIWRLMVTIWWWPSKSSNLSVEEYSTRRTEDCKPEAFGCFYVIIIEVNIIGHTRWSFPFLRRASDGFIQGERYQENSWEHDKLTKLHWSLLLSLFLRVLSSLFLSSPLAAQLLYLLVHWGQHCVCYYDFSQNRGQWGIIRKWGGRNP